MNHLDFRTEVTGSLVAITGVQGADYAFVPAPLPPNWQWPSRLWPLLMRARESLTLLKGLAINLPKAYVASSILDIIYG